ncbi:hypothetical protein [Haloparvum sedimenti]|uniref:hypothetical protein n=1 Tax=Haloparvum sedimenti TaxID=1678448 RepID=UPI00071E79C1|nr:hypothetical protein [Haloparvum sedimenti]
MLSKRLASTIATGLWVAGALLVGQALHVSVVAGEVPITAPAPVFYTVAGVALILVARNLDAHPSEYLDYVSGPDEDGAETGDAPDAEPDAGFDPAASPLDEEALENLEARERENQQE